MNILIRLLIHTTSGSDVNETSHPEWGGPLDMGGHFKESVHSLTLVTRGRGHPGDLEDPPTFPESCTVASVG